MPRFFTLVAINKNLHQPPSHILTKVVFFIKSLSCQKTIYSRSTPSNRRGRGFGRLGFPLLMLMAIFTIIIVYLLSINGLAVSGYQITEARQQLQRLKEETTLLEIEILKLRSLENIEKQMSHLEMVAVSHIDYLTPLGSVVVAK